jgi:hypothetical protein
MTAGLLAAGQKSGKDSANQRAKGKKKKYSFI